MPAQKRIVLKLTGTIFTDPTTGSVSNRFIVPLVQQLQQLITTYQIGIVIGGGNFFRGGIHGKKLGLTPWSGHSIGMLATIMNGLILHDLLTQSDITTTLLSAFDCPVAAPITQESVTKSLASSSCIVFAGGTGIPYFTTDTNAVIRSLQMGATELWKCTMVDGVYDSDPATNPHATLLSSITFKQALEKQLNIMDMTAFTLAQEHSLPIRILNIFKPDSLIHASQDPYYGSFIHP